MIKRQVRMMKRKKTTPYCSTTPTLSSKQKFDTSAESVITIIPAADAESKKQESGVTGVTCNIRDAECDDSPSSKLGMTDKQWRIMCRIRVLSHRGMQITSRTLYMIKKAERGEAGRMEVLQLVKRGLVTWADDGKCGPPKITIVGRGYRLAQQVGLAFFDICVLAVIYRYARVFAEGVGNKTSRPDTSAKQSVLSSSSKSYISIPLPTIQNYLIDWPGGNLKIRKSISHLRGAGLLPRPSGRPKSIGCNILHLQGISNVLIELDEWVEKTTLRIRHLLMYGVDETDEKKGGDDNGGGGNYCEPFPPHNKPVIRNGANHRSEIRTESIPVLREDLLKQEQPQSSQPYFDDDDDANDTKNEARSQKTP